jgi:hypothetical protein
VNTVGGTRSFTWRCVDYQIVQFIPENVVQELFYHCRLLWTAPNDGIVTVFQQETDRHDRQRFVGISVDRHPALFALVHIFALQVQ